MAFPYRPARSAAMPSAQLAAALQGAIFAVVKVAVDRGAAAGTRKLTGVWPGDEGQQPGKTA